MFGHGQVFLIKNRFCFLLIKTNFLHAPVTRKWPYFYKDVFMFEASKGLSPCLAFYHIHGCFPLPLQNLRETPLSTPSTLDPKQNKSALKIILCGCCRLAQSSTSERGLEQSHPVCLGSCWLCPCLALLTIY